MQNTKPYAYLITYRTYASWLHGDPRHSVHHSNTKPGSLKIPPNEKLQQQIQSQLSSDEFILDNKQSEIALQHTLITLFFDFLYFPGNF